MNNIDKIPKFIIHPHSRLRSYWNLVIIFLLLYTATYMPFKTCFIDDSSNFSDDLDNIFNALFGLDILITFISAYEEDNQTLQASPKEIAKNYIKSWFFLDLLAWYYTFY